MTDNFCYSVLKIAAQQIVQGAGFESANKQTLDTLTDVTGRYIELLGSTIIAYANLNGRTIGSEYDVVNAMKEVELEPSSLKQWLEQEGKLLTPSWTAQSDPGRLLEGVVNGGRNVDTVDYEYTDIHDYDLSPSPSTPPIESPYSSLPSHIPAYFPAFPDIKEDDSPLTDLPNIIQPKPHISVALSSEAIPAPIIVKNRKKPIDNPFTHIIPYEESSLIADEEQQALSLNVTISHTTHDPLLAQRSISSVIPLTLALGHIKDKDYRIHEGNVHQLFRNHTQNEAAPGNNLFNHDIGIFDTVIRNVADPLVVSKLSTPNLLIDTAHNNNSTTNTVLTITNTNPPSVNPPSTSIKILEEVQKSTTPAPTEPKLTKSSSMLAVLASGPPKKGDLKKIKMPKSTSLTLTQSPPVSSFIHTSSTNSQGMSINSPAFISSSKLSMSYDGSKSGESKYMMKKRKKQEMLLQQQQQQRTPQPQQQQQQLQMQQIQQKQQQHLQKQQQPPQPTPTPTSSTPISLASYSTGPEKKKQKKNPKLTLNLTQPSALDSLSSPSPSTPKIRFKLNPPEDDFNRLIKKPPRPKDTFKLEDPRSQPFKDKTDRKVISQYPTSPPYKKPSSVPFSKIPPQKPLLKRPVEESTSLPVYEPLHVEPSTEEIRCVCVNPTVDYGTFMIACDKCSVWFHGSCVGIAKTDRIDDWYCRRCRACFSL